MNKALMAIQFSLNAPKNKDNDYGKYKYRSAEGILEAVKPLLKEHNSELVITDKVVQMGDRYYVEATVIFSSDDGTVVTTAFAREPATKKGMDESQITGTASSYARKYALNGLFLIDDAKDADTNEHHRELKALEEEEQVSAQNVKNLTALANEKGVSIIAICDRYGVDTLGELTKADFVDATKALEATQKKGTKK